MRGSSAVLKGRTAALSAVLALAGFAAGAAVAAPPEKRLRPVPPGAAVTESRPWKGVLEIKVDAKTGQRRLPTGEEATALAGSLRGMLSRSTEGLSTVARPDGGRQVSLQGRFASVVLNRPGAGGANEVRCVTTFEEAVQFLGLVPADAADSGPSVE